MCHSYGASNSYDLNYFDILSRHDITCISCEFQTEFADPLYVEKITVYETFDGGSVKLIQLRSPEGHWESVFEEKPLTTRVYKKSRVYDIFPKVRCIFNS